MMHPSLMRSNPYHNMGPIYFEPAGRDRKTGEQLVRRVTTEHLNIPQGASRQVRRRLLRKGL